MDQEPPLEVIKHAQGIARHVVRLGFADLATTRQHFLDYFFYLKLGFDGSFTQILLARKVVDQHGFQMLERIAPFSQYVGREGAGQARMQSNVVRLPPGRKADPPQSSSSTLLYEGVLPTPPAAQQAAQTVFYEGVLPTPAGATPESTLPLPDFDPPTERTERPVTATLAPGEPFGGVATQYVDTGGPDAAASEVDLFFPELADRNRMPSGAHRLPSSGSHNLPSGAHGLPGGPPLNIYESPTHLESPTHHPGHENPTFLDGPTSEPSTHVDGPAPSAAVSAFDPIASWGLEENEIEVNLSRSQVAAKMGLPQAMPELAPQATPPGDLLPDTREEERGTLKSLKGLDPSDTGDLFWRSESGSGSGERPPETFLQPKLGGFLGEFELLEVLGQGGMGVVYKSRRQSTDKLYALKVLRVRQGAKLESRRKRFRREVKAMQRLRHPNIVNVHGYGRDGPFDWYVMEYVDGKDLASLMAARALDDEQKLELFLQVCGALIHSHERGVVHRDLKPQNILVDADLQVHILDFGLAKILDTDSGLTHTGSALGTPYYMSPEQVADPTKVGPRSDIFSLGVILYELITNQRPFPGVTAGEVGNKILSREPPPPSTVNKAVHPNLDVIAAKAMEKNPDRRYATIQALHDDLVRHMSGKGVKGQSPVIAGVRRYVEKNRSGLVIGVLVASVLFAVIGILGGIVYLFVAG